MREGISIHYVSNNHDCASLHDCFLCVYTIACLQCVQHMRRDIVNLLYISAATYLLAFLVAFYFLLTRDLTAQNILISEKNTAKVSNFELTRDATFNVAGCMLPIKWTAPEAISNGVSGLVDVE